MRSISNKAAWAAVIISVAGLGGATCMNSSGFIPSVSPPPVSVQTAAAINNATALASFRSTAVFSPTPGTPPSYGQTFYGGSSVQMATALNQFFNPTYDITGGAFTGQFTLTNASQQAGVTIIASNTSSRPQFSVQTVGGTPFFSNPPNNSSNILFTTFVSLISPNPAATIVSYQFSVIDTGVTPSGISYSVAISVQ